ncbi:MAG: hypothetical protein Ct9H300mP14_10420 [Gammaproteobacteria bacterium]|nr:MAG: hypothetical protein Ct9H300mP14_10420 [Gammaproteobacteria bacterium]
MSVTGTLSLWRATWPSTKAYLLADRQAPYFMGTSGSTQSWVRKNCRCVVCDSGDRYISKTFNDEWMRDMGYFAPPRKLGTVQDILEFKKQQVVLADPNDTLQSIINQMATLGISQMPMTVGQGDLRMIEELDILRAVAVVRLVRG